jgi:hypothetical protein
MMRARQTRYYLPHVLGRNSMVKGDRHPSKGSVKEVRGIWLHDGSFKGGIQGSAEGSREVQLDLGLHCADDFTRKWN